jgi:hypothetical protein
MIRAPYVEPRQCLTSRTLLEQTARRHGVTPVVVDGYLSAITYRPTGEAILWRAPVPADEAVSA